MKRNLGLGIIFIGILFFISSCSTSRIIGKSVPASRLEAQVNFTMDDLEYVGEVKGTSTQTYVLGFAVGGKRQFYGQVGTGGPNFPAFQSRGMNNALYQALNTRPDADFILPIAYDFEVNRMFLGKKVKINLRAKAFKLKTQTAESKNANEPDTIEEPVEPKE